MESSKVVNGGPSVTMNMISKEEPLPFERCDENKKMALQQCSIASDCLNGGCGRLMKGDTKKSALEMFLVMVVLTIVLAQCHKMVHAGPTNNVWMNVTVTEYAIK